MLEPINWRVQSNLTMLVNHLMYADDLVLLSPSAAGLSIFLSICSTYGIEYDVMYNSTKSNVLIFRSKLLKNVHVPEFEINNTAIDRVSMYKYLGHCIWRLLLYIHPF